MIYRTINRYRFLIIVFLFSAIGQVYAQHNVNVFNKSNRTVAVRVDGVLKNNLEPGDSKSYYINNKSTINFSLSETDPTVVQIIQSAAYQGNNLKFDWTQYQIGSSYVQGPGTINLLPELVDGNYTWVTLQVIPLQQQETYTSYDYDDDDDEDFVWYMVIGLVVGALIALLPM